MNEINRLEYSRSLYTEKKNTEGEVTRLPTITALFLYPVVQKQRHKHIDMFDRNQPGAQSERRRRCCGKYCMMLQRDGSGSSLRLQFPFPFVPVATRQSAAHTRTSPTNGQGEQSVTYQPELRLSGLLA